MHRGLVGGTTLLLMCYGKKLFPLPVLFFSTPPWFRCVSLWHGCKKRGWPPQRLFWNRYTHLNAFIRIDVGQGKTRVNKSVKYWDTVEMKNAIWRIYMQYKRRGIGQCPIFFLEHLIFPWKRLQHLLQTWRLEIMFGTTKESVEVGPTSNSVGSQITSSSFYRGIWVIGEELCYRAFQFQRRRL